jgi:hypothetical protein
MNTSIFAILAPLVFGAATVHAFAHASRAVAPHAPRAMVESAQSTLTDCVQSAEACRVARAMRDDTPSVVRLPATVIVGSSPRARVWSCGPVEANRIGGSQRTCEWR